MLTNWKVIFLAFAVGVVVVLVPSSAEAQDNPAAEIFGGYSYFRFDPGEGFDHVDGHGWTLDVTGNLNPRVGITVDVAGYYKSVDFFSITGGGTVDLNMYTFMVGPQIKLFKKGPLSSSLRIVAGGAHGGGELESGVGAGFTTETVFAASIGAAYDIRLGKRAAWRIYPSYLLTQFGNGNQGNFRFSTGIVFYLGGS